MDNNRTFTMIKPDAVQNGYSGLILAKIEEAGFKIVAMKITKLSKESARLFYEIHQEKPFFDDLVNYMTSGPIIAAILEKENAVLDFRELIGNTNPKEAKEGTIRQMYAKSIDANAIHGSDSDINASIEGEFHFSSEEIVS
ncbi:MAG: nucleoside-diphosphate kinase [Flavobacteriales bacterium]|nr:nucleoside-diphosphate kinase [Flavobacteriales bacterium]|tara:strand:- start:14218 stop:14640 length:423 start_codon:yes stop_codon:yes gene_type:complete